MVELRYEGGLEHKGSLALSKAELYEAEVDLKQATREIGVAREVLRRVIGTRDTPPELWVAGEIDDVSVPGAVEMVILLAAFTLHGLRAGPLLLVHHPEILYTIFLTFIFASFATLGIVWATLRVWVKVIETPKAILWPIVLFLCVIGAYTVAPGIPAMLIMIGVALFSLLMEKHGFSRIPLMMGLVLGPIMMKP